MKTIRMTDRWLRAISVDAGREEFADSITRGLRLRVSSRAKKWSVVTRHNNKQIRVPLGGYPQVSLLGVRDQANEILSAGSLPDFEAMLRRMTVSDTPALQSLCHDYIEKMKAKGQKSHTEYQRALIDSPTSFCNFMQSKLGHAAQVGDVRTAHVTEWLRDIYQRAPSHARHCRAYLHAVFAWAIKAEFDYTTTSGRAAYGISVNPVAATPGGAKSKARQRVLTTKELKQIWELAPQVAEPITATALRLIIAMGGLRVSEILHSERSWYKNGWLTLPETKNGREHNVPLTEHAMHEFKIAQQFVRPGSQFLVPHKFDNQQPMPAPSVGRVVKRLIEKFDMESFQLRDLRRTMKTHLLDGEYVEEREIDIWHNHGQNSDVARKHYSWAEYKHLKTRVAKQIDVFLGKALF